MFLLPQLNKKWCDFCLQSGPWKRSCLYYDDSHIHMSVSNPESDLCLLTISKWKSKRLLKFTCPRLKSACGMQDATNTNVICDAVSTKVNNRSHQTILCTHGMYTWDIKAVKNSEQRMLRKVRMCYLLEGEGDWYHTRTPQEYWGGGAGGVWVCDREVTPYRCPRNSFTKLCTYIVQFSGCIFYVTKPWWGSLIILIHLCH